MPTDNSRGLVGPGEEPAWELLQLPNGAQLVLAPMAGRASVAASILVRVGSRWESKRLAGVSHFLEHMVFKGTEQFPTSRDVSQSIEGLGGVLNASTDKELTVFWAKVPGAHLEVALRLLFDLTFAPLILSEEAERERNVILEELHMYLDQPGDLVQMIFDDLLWGDHPLSRDPVGTRFSLARIGAPELVAHRDTYYIPDRVVVVITGGFDAERAVGLVERCFDERAGATEPRRSRRTNGGAPAPLEAHAATRIRKRRGEQVHLLLGVRCSSYLDPARWALDVLNTVLGEGMSSRLFLELRENRALAYDVHSFAARHLDSGAFGIYMATQTHQVETAIRAALSEVARMAHEPLTAEELERSKTQTEGRLRLQLEGTSAMAEFLGHQAALVGSVMSPAEVIAAVRAVSSEDVQATAERLFSGSGSGWRLAAVGPGLELDPVQAAFEAGFE